jgi:hypothetical protein
MAGPGPNDYHMQGDAIQPGLGDDEPTEAQRAGIRSRGAAHLAKLKDDLAIASAELTVKERELLDKEQALLERERKLELAEKASSKKV